MSTTRRSRAMAISILREVFGLRLLVGGKLHLVQLGEAIDQLGHFAAEQIAQFALAGAGIFENVMKQCRADGIGIHAPLDHRTGNRQRVRDVRLAGHALLVRMGTRREGIGLLDACNFGRGKIIETVEENPVGGILSGGRMR